MTETISDILKEKLIPSQNGGYSIGVQMDINDIREALEDDDVVNSIRAIIIEYKRACLKWPKWPEDIVHAVGIMAGEAGECLRAANHYREGRPTEGMDSLLMVKCEAIQTGAMAVRLLANNYRKVEL